MANNILKDTFYNTAGLPREIPTTLVHIDPHTPTPVWEEDKGLPALHSQLVIQFIFSGIPVLYFCKAIKHYKVWYCDPYRQTSSAKWKMIYF